MLGTARIRALIPQQGAMCLLAAALRWDGREIRCRAVSHLDPANPLRAEGRLGAVTGVEYGMQAAALHGALTADAAPGVIAGLRRIALFVPRLDVAAFGALAVRARVRLSDPRGMIYDFWVRAADGRLLVAGQGTIVTDAAGPE